MQPHLKELRRVLRTAWLQGPPLRWAKADGSVAMDPRQPRVGELATRGGATPQRNVWQTGTRHQLMGLVWPVELEPRICAAAGESLLLAAASPKRARLFLCEWSALDAVHCHHAASFAASWCVSINLTSIMHSCKRSLHRALTSGSGRQRIHETTVRWKAMRFEMKRYTTAHACLQCQASKHADAQKWLQLECVELVLRQLR